MRVGCSLLGLERQVDPAGARPLPRDSQLSSELNRSSATSTNLRERDGGGVGDRGSLGAVATTADGETKSRPRNMPAKVQKRKVRVSYTSVNI